MAVTTLNKVLSRTKIFPRTSSKEAINKEQTYCHVQNSSATDHDSSDDAKKSSSLSLKVINIPHEGEAKDEALSLLSMTLPSPRKHSYASVKEDSDVLQSFTVRRLLYESETRNNATHKAIDSWKESGQLTLEDAVDESAISNRSCESLVLDDTIETPVSCHVKANLDTMPDEILDLIFSLVTLDHDTDRLISPAVDLFSLLFVSKLVHAAALRVLYRHVKIPQSKSFFKFLNSLTQDQQLGELVQCLDFSHYSSIGFGRAKSVNNATPYLTPTTLKSCLDKTTGLQAFLVHEHVDDELDITVLAKLFGMPSLRALDLCACSSIPFTKAFTDFCTRLAPSSSTLSIQRLSLHECTTLQPKVFEALLPRLPRLTHLDVAHTMINDTALMSIPHSARITHLNIERCTQLTGEAVVQFLTTHPAVKDTIVYLNLQADSSRYRLLSEDDLTKLLPTLPTCLKSLNIGGARVNKNHTDDLRRLSWHLEELGLKGADLSLGTDVCKILSLDTQSSGRTQHTLRYVDLTDVSSVNQCSLTYSPIAVVDAASMPLEVIEVGESVRNEIEKRAKNIKNPDWKVRELGRRGWYVRQDIANLQKAGTVVDDGCRSWKMGARWWGMRKIPVYDQSVGGMYGYFMFKRG